ncbi:hypothetical protein [Labilibaculum antarcticum]|nr:hypothetical protein [Labilibaculum antarcticum]
MEQKNEFICEWRTGKYRRHVKIKSLDEVKTKSLDFFVKQAQMDDQ